MVSTRDNLREVINAFIDSEDVEKYLSLRVKDVEFLERYYSDVLIFEQLKPSISPRFLYILKKKEKKPAQTE